MNLKKGTKDKTQYVSTEMKEFISNCTFMLFKPVIMICLVNKKKKIERHIYLDN